MMGTVLSLVDLVDQAPDGMYSISPILSGGNSDDSNNCGSDDSRGC